MFPNVIWEICFDKRTASKSRNSSYTHFVDLARWRTNFFLSAISETIGTSALQSRCLAGVANGTIVFVLPGSLDAVLTGWDRLIRAQLDASCRPCNLVQLLPASAKTRISRPDRPFPRGGTGLRGRWPWPSAQPVLRCRDRCASARARPGQGAGRPLGVWA